MFIPNALFFTKGVGIHSERLIAFELALRDAGIEGCNLVPVSSIFPPHCAVISKQEGLKLLKPGAITFCVWARMETNIPKTTLSTCVAAAIPQNPNRFGYLAEHHTYDRVNETTPHEAEPLPQPQTTQTYTEGLARTLFGSRHGDDAFTVQSTAAASTHKNANEWTTVLSTAVLVSR